MAEHSELTPENSELGRQSAYESEYAPDKLFPIPRHPKRAEIGISDAALPFRGFDRWTHYEVSWLNPRGKPRVAVADIHYPCTSPNLIESKSMKLYFNSLNNSQFESMEAVANIVRADLCAQVGAEVSVTLHSLQAFHKRPMLAHPEGHCLDTLDVACTQYQPTSSLLHTHDERVSEVLYSDLLKSNCLVTQQPDWGSVQVAYQGRRIDPAGLLKYIVSFRNHNEFHEQCIERIFQDILQQCQPNQLTVQGYYTRRGGVEINPYRSTEPHPDVMTLPRLCRQ